VSGEGVSTKAAQPRWSVPLVGVALGILLVALLELSAQASSTSPADVPRAIQAFETPLQAIFCGSESNPGYLAFKEQKRSREIGEKDWDCSASRQGDTKNVLPGRKFYCEQIEETSKSLRNKGLDEAELLKFELEQEFRRQILNSRVLTALKQAYEDHQKRLRNLPAAGESSCGPIEQEFRKSRLEEVLRERLYCLSGNRDFSNKLFDNLTAFGPETGVLAALGLRPSVLELAQHFSQAPKKGGGTPRDQTSFESPNALGDEDLVYLGPTLNHYAIQHFWSKTGGGSDRGKLCYYASVYQESVLKGGKRLDHVDSGLGWLGMGAGTAGAFLFASGIGAPVAGVALSATELAAWGSTSVLSYRALKNFFGAIYPHDSLGELSLLLSSNPHDNSCSEVAMVPTYLEETLAGGKAKDEAQLWQSLFQVAAAFCNHQCLDAAAFAKKLGQKVYDTSAIKEYLQTHYHDFDWSRALPKILATIQRFLEARPDLQLALERSIEIGSGAILSQRGAALAGGLVGASKKTAQDYVGGVASTSVSTGLGKVPVAEDPELITLLQEENKRTKSCDPKIPKEKVGLYRKYLAKRFQQPKGKPQALEPSDCLLIGDRLD
jgi:hypothetical protein